MIAHGATGAAFRGKPSVSMIGLLVVEMIIGYEWFISGLVKFVRGGFPAGLADELLEKSAETPEWYNGFLTSVAAMSAQGINCVGLGVSGGGLLLHECRVGRDHHISHG